MPETEITPATLQDVLDAVNSLHDDVHELHVKLGQLVESHNQVGQNVAWLVANTQGIFQTFQDPNFMSNMMSGLMGGMSSGGFPGAGKPNSE